MSLFNQLGRPQTLEEKLRQDMFGGQAPIVERSEYSRNMPPAPAPAPVQKPSFFQRASAKLADPAYRAQMAAAFNTMRMNPDPTIAQRAADMATSNQTAKYFEGIDRPDLAEAVRTQPTLAADVYKAFLTNQLSPKSTFTQMSGAQLNAQLEAKGQPPAYDNDKVYNVDQATSKVSQIGGGDTNIDLGNLTESQGAASNFYNRARNANKLLSDVENQGTEVGQALLGKIPLIGNMLVSPEYQYYQTLKVNFLTAVLRKESGAVIGIEELQTEDQKYFPQIGDSQKTIEEKRRARLDAIEGLKIQSGTGASRFGSGLPDGVKVEKVK